MAKRARTKQPQEGSEGRKVLVRHRRAHYEFEILERVECGIVLRGTEVKSARAGNASLAESFVRVDDDEVFWVKGHIDEYRHGNIHNHEPTRRRKLLLRRSEIRKLGARVRERGFTLVPLCLYVGERGLLKLEVGLCRGKRRHDKRDAERRKTERRDLAQER